MGLSDELRVREEQRVAHTAASAKAQVEAVAAAAKKAVELRGLVHEFLELAAERGIAPVKIPAWRGRRNDGGLVKSDTLGWLICDWPYAHEGKTYVGTDGKLYILRENCGRFRNRHPIEIQLCSEIGRKYAGDDYVSIRLEDQLVDILERRSH